MKKLILLLLPFALSSEVFAQQVASATLENEKKYFLAVTTSNTGEKSIGSHHYVKIGDSTPTFYVKKTRSCKSDPECTDELMAGVLASAKRFAADYNALVGKEVVTVSDGSSWGGVPISLVSDLNSFGWWNCQRGFSTGSMRQCGIRLRVNNHDHINQTVAHEMLNLLGIQDTSQVVFKECISYDGGNYADYPDDYYGLCEVEKKAILLAFKHLRPGTHKGKIGRIFDKEWGNITSELAASGL